MYEVMIVSYYLMVISRKSRSFLCTYDISELHIFLPCHHLQRFLCFRLLRLYRTALLRSSDSERLTVSISLYLLYILLLSWLISSQFSIWRTLTPKNIAEIISYIILCEARQILIACLDTRKSSAIFAILALMFASCRE